MRLFRKCFCLANELSIISPAHSVTILAFNLPVEAGIKWVAINEKNEHRVIVKDTVNVWKNLKVLAVTITIDPLRVVDRNKVELTGRSF